jgi:hypothetical protein
MDTAVLTTLLFNTAGILAFALGMVLAYCLPNRHQTRPWVLTDADAAARPVAPTKAKTVQVDAELPHAA